MSCKKNLLKDEMNVYHAKLCSNNAVFASLYLSFCNWPIWWPSVGLLHGPLYIQHHDALVSVVHHTLLQDPPDVLHEQDTSTSDCSHPEDIYHPNFLPWSPCLLWPLRCTTQSATMSAAPQAGSLTSLEANCLWIFWHLDIISIINPIYNYWQIYD